MIAAEEVQSEAGILERVFVQDRRDGRVNIIRSQTGRIRDDGDDLPRWFLFEDGTSYQIDVDGNVDRASDFKSLYYRAATLDEATAATKRRARSTRFLSTSTAPKEIAEFQWRIVVPMVSLVLGLIGIPLGRTRPGQTPYARLIVAVVVYAAVFNLAQIVRIAVESEQIPRFPGVYIVPVGIAAIFLMAQRIPEDPCRHSDPFRCTHSRESSRNGSRR